MKDEIVDTLREMLNIDSDNQADKGPIIGYTRERLEGLGMEVTVLGEGVPALCATSGSKGLIFSGHLDTVPIGKGWTRGQGEIVGERVYGRGTLDMKGAVSAMFHAASTLTKEGVPFSILLTTDEEEGMDGAAELSKLEVVKEAPGIIICEPTDMVPVFREKGVFRFRLRTRGQAAHSSQSWLGENAILKMHDILAKLRDMAETPEGPTEGMTMSLTTVEGGVKNNVVPDLCESEIDVRFPPDMHLDDVRSRVLGKLEGEDYEWDAITELEAFETSTSGRLLNELKEYLGKRETSVSYATEAARYGEVNPETCICGPGKAGKAHMADEWVDMNQLVETYNMLIHLAGTFQG